MDETGRTSETVVSWSGNSCDLYDILFFATHPKDGGNVDHGSLAGFDTTNEFLNEFVNSN